MNCNRNRPGTARYRITRGYEKGMLLAGMVCMLALCAAFGYAIGTAIGKDIGDPGGLIWAAAVIGGTGGFLYNIRTSE